MDRPKNSAYYPYKSRMFLPIVLFKVDLLNFSRYCNIMQNPPKKLLDQVREAIRLKHYSYRTEQTYVQWIVRYILFHNKRHPKDMGVPEIDWTTMTRMLDLRNIFQLSSSPCSLTTKCNFSPKNQRCAPVGFPDWWQVKVQVQLSSSVEQMAQKRIALSYSLGLGRGQLSISWN